MFIRNGKPINIDAQINIGDVQYPPGYFRDATVRAAAGISEVADPVRPDDRYYFVTTNIDGTFASAPKDIDQVKAMKRSEIAASRFNRETGGITIAGMAVATDRSSQAMISGALLSVSRNPAMLIDWKKSDGSWIQIDKATVETIADAVSAHVQACFSAERARCDALQSIADFEAVIAFDVEISP